MNFVQFFSSFLSNIEEKLKQSDIKLYSQWIKIFEKFVIDQDCLRLSVRSSFSSITPIWAFRLGCPLRLCLRIAWSRKNAIILYSFFCRKIIRVRLLSEELQKQKISWKGRNVTISQYSEIMCTSERHPPCNLYLLSPYILLLFRLVATLHLFPTYPKTNRKYRHSWFREDAIRRERS